MIEKLGKGEVSHKEAREILRQEKKALSIVGRQVLGSKMYRTSAPNVQNRPRSSGLPPPHPNEDTQPIGAQAPLAS